MVKFTCIVSKSDFQVGSVKYCDMPIRNDEANSFISACKRYKTIVVLQYTRLAIVFFKVKPGF